MVLVEELLSSYTLAVCSASSDTYLGMGAKEGEAPPLEVVDRRDVGGVKLDV